MSQHFKTARSASPAMFIQRQEAPVPRNGTICAPARPGLCPGAKDEIRTAFSRLSFFRSLNLISARHAGSPRISVVVAGGFDYRRDSSFRFLGARLSSQRADAAPSFAYCRPGSLRVEMGDVYAGAGRALWRCASSAFLVSRQRSLLSTLIFAHTASISASSR